ncbi:MAG: AsmA family protein [Proteobacteria bacterium]|nr:AsmA family protein [Pseudomonadota bacterium]
MAGLIVAPGFIDWTPYRDTFARQLSAAIGRPVAIEGNVTFALVPRPALEAGRVRIGGGAETVTIAEVKAWLGLGPLLRGDLYFRDLRLDDVNGVLGIDLPWTPAPAAEGVALAAPAERSVSVDVDRVALNGGDLTLRDQSGATVLRAHGMDLVFSNEARDRFRVVGDVSLDDHPMTLDAQVGTAGRDGVRAVSVSARVPAAETAINFSGRLSLAARTLEGDITVKADRGAPLMVALGWPGLAGAPALQRPLVVSAKSSVSPMGIALTGMSLDAGGSTAKGAVDWRRERTPQLNVSFDFAPVTLEDWRLAATAAAPAAVSTVAPSQAPSEAVASRTLTADIALRFPALSLRGESLRDGHLTATLANGELKISDLAVTLPGTTRLSGFGLVNFADTAPALDGVVTLQTFDARSLLTWLGVDVASVPAGRLGSASFQGALQGTLNFIELNDIEAALDTARIGGRLSFAPRARPFVGIDLRAQIINLDNYRGVRPSSSPAPASPAAKPDVYGVTASGAAFTGLGDWDAEVHVQLDDVIAGGLPGGRVGLDLGLKDGKLDIRTASFEKIAGTTAWLSGSVGGFGGALQFNNLQFDLAGDDIARLAALAGLDVTPALKSLGQVSLTGTINGGTVQADVSATLKAAGLTARATGQVMELDRNPRFTGRVDAAHPRFSDLMKTASSWPANMRDPGALAAQVRIMQEAGKTTISDAKISIGRDRISGSAEITEVDGRKHVNARLTDIALDLDRLLPPDAPVQAPAKPASAKPAQVPVAAASPWSQDKIKWSFLKGWNGEVSVAGSSFAARGVQLGDFSARIVVADNAAELADWQGKIFGAPGQFFLRLAASPEPSFQGQLVVNRADFRALVTALNGGRTSLKSSGTADIVASFSAKGASAAAFANSLAGSGTLKVTAVETGNGLSAGLLGPLSAAAQLDVGTPGKPAPSTFSTRLSAANGAIKLENAEVASRSHTGRFAGVIDLPRRQVDISGRLVPRKAGEDQLPISIKGAMDRPNIRLLPPPK